MKRNIQTTKAPLAVGPYSQGVLVNGTLYVSGQLPLNPQTNTLEATSIEEQTAQSLQNVLAIVTEAGLKKENIVRVGIFMSDLNDFPKMNTVYQNFFLHVLPARSTVEVRRLPKDVLIEIDAICVED